MGEGDDMTEHPAIWFQASACSGCVVSVLNGVAPNIRDLIVDHRVPGHHVSLRFQPTVMAAAGDAALEILAATEEVKEGYVLVVEGAVPTGAGGLFGYAAKRGAQTTMHARALELAENALAIVALGTCSSYGGMHAAEPNPAGCVSIGEALSGAGIEKPVINVPGCPPHPDWFTGTVAHALLFGLPGPDAVDTAGRPKRFYGRLVHDLCQRRGDFEAHKFAEAAGEPGCLYELGCKGPWTHADCPEREFNGGVNWCVKAGSPCQGCVEPFFPDVSCPIYAKIGLLELPRIVRDEESGELVAVRRP
ncbi:MAG: hydrogenase small subunit [Armatimonadota bacterium]|nr:MAG: hydrogenase small subunit [Armatimonadota bacterium]